MQIKLFLGIVFISTQCYGFDSIKLDEKSSLFIATDKTVPIVTAKFVGWGENWLWAGVKVKPDVLIRKNESLSSVYNGNIPKLDVDFSSTISSNKNVLSWAYIWNKKSDYPNAMGFGIEFNLKLDSASFESAAQAPEFLSDNQGWRWKTPDGQAIEVKFSPALAKLYFERNQKNKIRGMFFTAISKGTEKTTMTVSLTSKNSGVLGAVALDYDGKDMGSWNKDILSDLASPIDLSFLNADDSPAGTHGFVKAKGDQLVFSDGMPAKFWGANIMAYALFSSSNEEIKAHAKRIAQLGLNLIRIHHHDSGWVKPNIFNNPLDKTQELSLNALEKLDFWIKCLKDEGVYTWLDLHVGRAFTTNDGIDDLDEIIAKRKPKKNNDKERAEVKGFNYYNESIQKQMQKFNESYLTHVNPYTHLAYKDDPAIIALLVTNENDLTQHFGSLFQPNKSLPKHYAIVSNDLKHFSEASGFSAQKSGRAWEMGEPKIYFGDVEHRFNQKMLTHLRSLGARSMIATTNSWGKMGLSGLPSLMDGDLIDAHSYARAEEFNYNPRYNPGFLAWIGAAQVTGKPLSVTEWNIEPFPAADRFTAPIFTAAIANLQSWDAMMLYGYSQGRLGKTTNGSNYSSFNDPAMIGLMPAAALLYRQNHVSAAKQNYELKLSGDDFFYKKQDPTTSKTIRTLLETSRYTVTVPDVKELPWLKANIKPANNATVVSDANKDFIPQGQEFVQSDTGELKRDWSKGIHTINTPKSQIVSGWIGGETLSLQGAEFKIKTKKAVVAVQSIDNKPIKDSKSIFITVMARSMPETGNKLPFLSEPVIGEIVVSAPSGLKLFPINRLGEREKPLNVSYAKGKYTVKLDEKNEAHWFMLSAN